MIRRLKLIITLILCTPFWANAEVITLDKAVELALEADPRIEERRHLVEAARALLQQALGSDDVIVDVNAFVGLANELEGGFFEADGKTPRDDKYDFDGVSAWSSVRFSIIKPLYTFGKIENYADAARGNIAVKQEDVRLQRAKTIMDVHRAYNGYLAARDTKYLFEDVDKRVDKVITLVDQWLEDGINDVRQSDLYALQSGKAVVNKFLAQAEAIERIALAGLKVLIGVDQDSELEIADRRIRPVPAPEEPLEVLQKKALQLRPEMSQLESGLRARRALVAAHKAEKRPNIYAGVAGVASYAPRRDRLDNPYIYDPFNDYGATPLIGIQWKWETGVQAAKVAGAKAELDALVEKSSFAQHGIPFEVAEQYYQMQAHNMAVIKLEQGSRAARRWMIGSYADFEAGVQDAESVLTAFQGYVLVHSEYLRAVNDYNMYVVRLRQVTGDYQ